MELAGRVALVTGAGQRVGQALAVALGARGMRVAVHYRGSAAGADETCQRIAAAGGEAYPLRADLAGPDAPAALVAEAAAHFGALDVLVNSAAVMERTPVDEVTPAQWDAMFAVNLRAPFFCAQAAGRAGGARGGPHPPPPRAARGGARGGAIVNLADLAAFETWPAYVPHTVTKAGVVQMTRALARALAPRVRVNAVAPGTVLLPEGWDAESAERLRRTTPLQRNGSPADVAHAVLYLLEADYVTGETILVDGGRHVRT